MFGFVNSHFHTPETFSENSAALADNADVRERLFDGFRSEIVAIAEGRELGEPFDEADDADEADDDEAADEADEDGDEADIDPVTDARIERDQAIERILLDTFDSDLYGEVFDSQLRQVQSQIVETADIEEADRLRNNGDVSLNARALWIPIYEALADDPATAEITQNEVPAQYGIYKIADRETTVDAAWWTIKNGPNWRSLTFALAIVSLIGAVVLAERRPTRAIQYGAGLIGVSLVVVVLVYILRAVVPLFADGRGSDGAVVAVYASTVAPLVSSMIRLVIIGAVLAVVGWVAKLIWPDDWVYGQVADDRGVRSVRSRRGSRQAEQPQQQQPQQRVAAAVPVAYNPYAPPYGGGYPPPGWGPAPYPGQQPYGQPGYAPGYQQYPAGPYAQPAQPTAPPANTGRPTVPVMPVPATTGETPVADAAPPVSGDLPADAAQIVPKVVASASPPVLEPVADPVPTEPSPVVEDVADAPASAPIDGTVTRDQWATDADW